MSNPEQSGDSAGLDMSEFEALFAASPSEPTDIGEMLLMVVARNNELAEEAHLSSRIHTWDQKRHDLPTLGMEDWGNRLTVGIPDKGAKRTSTNFLIGYFSPVDNGYVIYPELVEEGDMPIIQAEALLMRDSILKGFNKRLYETSLTRDDYSHPEVRRLHAEHHAYLESGGIRASNLLTGHNLGLPANQEKDFIEIDEYSQASFCLSKVTAAPLPAGNGEKPAVQNVGLRVNGGFRWVEGVKIRHAEAKIAEMAKINDDPEEDKRPYLPLGKLQDYEVAEIDDIVDGILLTMQSLGQQGIKFDPAKMAAIVKPGQLAA
jgi:hypothetical protein